MIRFKIEQLLGYNIHVGHARKLSSSSMERFLLGYRYGICIININFTSFMLKRALNFVKDVASQRGIVLFCGLSKFSEFHQESTLLVRRRWMGGTLTNLSQSFNNLLGCEMLYDGFLPSVLVLLGEDRNKYAIINEANNLGIPSVALIDSDMQSYMAMYSIPANNDMFNTIKFFFSLFKRAIISGYIEEEIRIDEELERKNKQGSSHYRS